MKIGNLIQFTLFGIIFGSVYNDNRICINPKLHLNQFTNQEISKLETFSDYYREFCMKNLNYLTSSERLCREGEHWKEILASTKDWHYTIANDMHMIYTNDYMTYFLVFLQSTKGAIISIAIFLFAGVILLFLDRSYAKNRKIIEAYNKKVIDINTRYEKLIEEKRIANSMCSTKESLQLDS